ncbi:MAG: 50S ribosomal protein L16 [Candidatus Aenigmatarchaeota archaeon]
MGLRPGKCYRKMQRAFTRQSQRKPRKSYIKGVPRHGISSFEMGKKKNYSNTLHLVSKQNVQIRHNSLESSRIATVQHLEKKISKGATFFLRLRPYPHQVLRENALATGAGADRFQQGMRLSFGKPIGTAARVKIGQTILEVSVDKNNIDVAKGALKAARHKLPTTCKIIIMENKIAKV